MSILEFIFYFKTLNVFLLQCEELSTKPIEPPINLLKNLMIVFLRYFKQTVYNIRTYTNIYLNITIYMFLFYKDCKVPEVSQFIFNTTLWVSWQNKNQKSPKILNLVQMKNPICHQNHIAKSSITIDKLNLLLYITFL